MLHLYIATRENKIYDAEAKLVTLPSVSGVITVLDGHENLMSTIDAGEIILEDKTGKNFNYAGYNGVINVVTENKNTRVSVLLESAEDVSLIDLEEAEKALTRAKEANIEKFDNVGIDENNLVLRELSRVKIAKKYR